MTLASYFFAVALLLIFSAAHASSNKQTLIENSQLENDADKVQMNISRGIVHLLSRMESLEQDLCDKKNELAKVQEQYNSLGKVMSLEYELGLSKLKMNMSKNISQCEIDKTKLELKYQQQLREAEINAQNSGKGCGNNGKSLNMVKLETGRYFFSGGIKLNWFNAHKFCTLHGLQLLTIETALENNAVIKKLREIGFPDRDNYWTSGTDLGQEGHWFWMTSGSEFVYTAWHPNQPDNYKGNQNCLHIWNVNNAVLWDDGNCPAALKFICEMPHHCQ